MAAPANRTAVTAADNTNLPAPSSHHSSPLATIKPSIETIAASGQSSDDNVLPLTPSSSTIPTASIADMQVRVDFPPIIEPNTSQYTSGLKVSSRAHLQSDIEPNMTSATASEESSCFDPDATGSQNMPAASQPDCLFLDKLPPEIMERDLRDDIHE
ncbi:hypothetical protein CBER1_08826 [Cercospora berteroae]|uniref:Uncharacterized protein n=1 Tax=Cercospora berteroae TaxID=357750 RepID=A0A2S6BW07_9PEZI|nr:hypothetical protein CBER1_08826 [Cercospora berteroae]